MVLRVWREGSSLLRLSGALIHFKLEDPSKLISLSFVLPVSPALENSS